MATQRDSDPLIHTRHGEVRSLQAIDADDGSTVVIVTDTPGGRSLMNASESVFDEVQTRFPGARVVEHWPEDPNFGPFRERDGKGGSRKLDPAELEPRDPSAVGPSGCGTDPVGPGLVATAPASTAHDGTHDEPPDEVSRERAGSLWSATHARCASARPAEPIPTDRAPG